MPKCKRCGAATDGALADLEVCQDCWEEFCSVTWWQALNQEPLANLDEWMAKGMAADD